MIWLRRIFVLPLALVFIVLFIALLVVNRANATAGNPDFYIGQLERADVYNFIYDDIMPAALDELESDMDSSDWPVDVALLKSKLPGMMEQALPPEWLQAQVEQSFTQLLPYVMGDTDNFTISIPVEERVAAVAGAVKGLLHDEEFYSDLYEQAVDYAVDESASLFAELPEVFRLTGEEVDSIIRSVLPADWIHSQVDLNIDEITAYLTGDQEHFTLRLDVSDRLDSLEDAVTDILMRPETYDYAINDMLVSYVQEKIGGAGLPEDIAFTDSEIAALAEEVLPAGWYEARVNEVVAEVFAYLRGDRETVEISVYLADLKPAAIDEMAALADQKLEDLYNSLPIGTAEQTAEFLANPPEESLPDYRPAGLTYEQVKEMAGIDIESLTADLIDEWIPDEFVFSDAEIREALAGDDGEDLLIQARDLVRDGVTFTDADLHEKLGEDYKTIEDAREWVTTDFLITEQDLHEFLIKDEGGMAADDWQTINDVRSIVGTARGWLWVAWLVPALLLAGIGFLGGRKWYSRIIWAASVLAVAALIAYVAFGPVFSAVARPEIDKAIAEAAGGNEGLGALAADKAVAIVEDTVDSVIGGIDMQAIIIFGVSLAIIAAAIFWHFWSRRNRPVPEQIPEDTLPPPTQPPSGDQPPDAG